MTDQIAQCNKLYDYAGAGVLQVVLHVFLSRIFTFISFLFEQPVREVGTKEETWFDIGREVGLSVVDDDDVEDELAQKRIDEADEEVKRLHNVAEERKRRVMRGIKL